MPEALKKFFDAARVKRIAAQIRSASPEFPEREFVRFATSGLEWLELLERARLIAAALAKTLPAEFPKAAEILIRSLGPELDPHKDVLGLGMEGFHYLPHVLYTAEHGVEHFDAAMRLQHELTRRFSAEYSIRVFLLRYPERTLAVLRTWAKDTNSHVRRLVSEGTRPRLPWAMRLKQFQKDPAPVIELLEMLKDDPAEYVRRSVANNLNDIGKDHPKILIETCRRWMRDATPERRKLIAHALRSAVKRGDAGALAVLGFGAAIKCRVSATISPRRVRVGKDVAISVFLTSQSTQSQRAIIDAAVHFVKANGSARPKVFKLKALTLGPRQSIELCKRLSLREMTTRQHYAGRHEVDVLVNGTRHRVGAFEVH